MRGLDAPSDIDVAPPQSITHRDGTGVWLGSSPPITVLRVLQYIIINVRGAFISHDSTACPLSMPVWFCSGLPLKVAVPRRSKSFFYPTHLSNGHTKA